MRTPVTIRDGARLAEAHPGTGSRALNEPTRGLVNLLEPTTVMRASTSGPPGET
jgi:hypothetical protein